jgi:DNA end-binding protein Ku
MDALKRSLAGEKQSAPADAKAASNAKAANKDTNKGKKPRKAAAGQREMLLPISGSGKRPAKQVPKQDLKQDLKKAEKPARTQVRAKKAG